MDEKDFANKFNCLVKFEYPSINCRISIDTSCLYSGNGHKASPTMKFGSTNEYLKCYFKDLTEVKNQILVL